MQVAALFLRIIDEKIEQEESEFERWWETNRNRYPNIVKDDVKKIWLSGMRHHM